MASRNLLELIDKGEIYMITNIGDNINKNKKYIGKAPKLKKNLCAWGTQGRWNSHKSNVRNDKGNCRLLYNDMKLYGIDNFIVEKIKDCSKDDMDFFEKKLIQEYNTLSPSGYNLTEGGNKGKRSNDALNRNGECISDKALCS